MLVVVRRECIHYISPSICSKDMSAMIPEGLKYSTPHGEGVLQQTRPDGFNVLTLSSWKLADGCKVRVYTKDVWRGGDGSHKRWTSENFPGGDSDWRSNKKSKSSF